MVRTVAIQFVGVEGTGVEILEVDGVEEPEGGGAAIGFDSV